MYRTRWSCNSRQYRRRWVRCWSLGRQDRIPNSAESACSRSCRLQGRQSLVGKKITLKKFRDGALGDIFPIDGTIIKRINLNNEKNWLLVELDESFAYNGQNISMTLIKRKDDKTIRLKDKNQISFLRLVYNEMDLENTTDNTKFPFIDWIRCE